MRKKEYVPPMAEMILLAPCERLASWDSKYTDRWFNEFKVAENASAGDLGIIKNAATADDFWTDSGFTIKSQN